MGEHAGYPLRLAAAKAAIAAVLALLILASAESATAAGPTIKAVGAAGLQRPAGSVADTVLAPRFDRGTSTGRGATYTAPGGARVSVDVSTAYRTDPALVQRLVDFVASLVHGPELGRLAISIQTPTELQRTCGIGADACYAPASMRMVVPGEDRPSATLEHLLAHEYGHHVLANQRNAPWDATAWGGKRWATHERVCSRQESGTVFPGDEAEHYRLNPAEAFAETYRVVNAERAGTWGASPWIVDPLFYPDATAARLLQEDVLHPLGRPRTLMRTFASRYGEVRRWAVATPWDGVFRASARGGKIRLLDRSGRALSGWKRSAEIVVCGSRSLTIAVRGAAAGRIEVTVRRP